MVGCLIRSIRRDRRVSRIDPDRREDRHERRAERLKGLGGIPDNEHHQVAVAGEARIVQPTYRFVLADTVEAPVHLLERSEGMSFRWEYAAIGIAAPRDEATIRPASSLLTSDRPLRFGCSTVSGATDPRAQADQKFVKFSLRSAEARAAGNNHQMLLILIIVLIVVALAGGFGYGGGAYRGPGIGIVGVLLIILLVLALTGSLG